MLLYDSCHTHNRIDYQYFINNHLPNSINSVRDLGVLMDSSFSYSSHINNIINTALKILGFIKRFSRDFRNPVTLRVLYTSLVRAHLKYATVIWCPYHREHVNSLESVQRRFLRFASFKLGSPMSRFDHEYSHLMRCLGLPSLEERRLVADSAFLFNILNGNINCPCLLALIDFNACPRPLRTFPCFGFIFLDLICHMWTLLREFFGLRVSRLSRATYFRLLFLLLNAQSGEIYCNLCFHCVINPYRPASR